MNFSLRNIFFSIRTTSLKKHIQIPFFLITFEKFCMKFSLLVFFRRGMKQGKLRLETTLFDEKYSKNRAVQDLHLSPIFPDLALCSFSQSETDSALPNGLVLVWNVLNTLKRPEYVFTTQVFPHFNHLFDISLPQLNKNQSTVTSVRFSDFSRSTIIGGTYSGQITLWDIRSKNSSPVQQSSITSKGHTHPIYSTEFVGTKNAHNLVSFSTDGKMCVWAPEKLTEPVVTGFFLFSALLDF